MAYDRALYPKEAEVTNELEAEVATALLKAYPSPSRSLLFLRLRNKWGVAVEDDISSLAEPGGVVAARIAQYARAQGRLLDLLGLAWTDVPGNAELSRLADAWLTDKEGVRQKYNPAARGNGDSAAPAPPSLGAQQALEKLVATRSRLIDIGQFIDGMERLSGALCRISIPQVSGTGFLVGRRHVLTNFHVVEDAIQSGRTGDQILCEFDFNKSGAKIVGVRGAVDERWCRKSSPYSPSDLTGVGDPGPNDLDFALITLAEPVDPGRRALGWPISPPIITERDFLVIGQHPQGQVAQIAFGEVVELPKGGLRYRYDVTTSPGSSGSPVLDMDLKLVGLHHAADPKTNPKYNQCVPISRIMTFLQAEKIDLSTP